MRIAFVNQPWDSSRPPKSSLSIWTYEVARRVADRHTVTVFGHDTPESQGTETVAGVTYRHMPNVPDGFWTRFARHHARLIDRGLPEFASRMHHQPYMQAIARGIAEGGFEAVHLFNFSQYVPLIRKYNPRIRILLNMQCEWLTQLPPALVRQRMGDVDTIVGCSDYIRDLIAGAYPDLAPKCQTIFNGVDVDHFQRNGDVANVETAGRRLLFVGRVSPEKGIHVILDALPAVLQRCPDVHLDIVGPNAQCPLEYIVGLSSDPRIAELARFYDGTSYDVHLRRQADRLGIADRVHFVGFVAHADAPRYYHQSTLLLNPSFSESFGMALAEAMAAGVPVVGGRVGGMTNIVQPGRTGLLVDPGDAGQLAEAILSLLTDESTRQDMVAPARQRARDLFAWDRIAERFEQLAGATS